MAYSWAHDASARPVEVGAIPTGTIHGWYHDAQRIDPWPGGAYPGASPHYDGTSVLAGAQVMQAAGFITGYRWAFSFDDVIRTLGYLGPVILGIAWYDTMYEPDPDGTIHPRGEVVGGHAILARGVDVRRRRILLRNSWGRGYGRDGDCYLSFDDLARLLAQDGEACVPVGRMTPPSSGAR